MLSAGYIPPFLGGLFGPMSLLYFMIFLILFPFTYRKILNASPLFYASTLLFFIFCFCWVLAHYLINKEPYIEMASIQALSSLVMWLALFFIGIHFSYENKIVVRLFIVFFIIISIGLIYFTFATGKTMFYAIRLFDVEDDAGVASYQGFARSALVCATLVFCYKQNFYKRVATALASVIILFLLGARSELYGFLFFCGIYFMAISTKRLKWLLLSICLLVIICLVVVLNFEWLLQSRQLEVVDLSQSKSWIERQHVQDMALKQISDNPVFGYFGGHIADTGKMGSNAHNALSAWLAYSFLGFFTYLALTVVATVHSFICLMKFDDISPRWLFAFALNSICFLLVIASKSVLWALPALGWGMYVNAIINHKQDSKNTVG
jgi:O-antigen ligase